VSSLAGRTVLVLCDAAETTGLGHFVRCASLAAVLTGRGADVRLLLPEDSAPRAVDQARAAGWEVTVGPWLPGEIPGVPGARPVVIVDSYRVSGAWLTDLRSRLAAGGGVLMVVDDLADRHFDADLVLNQNVGAERLPYPGAGRLLAGPGYALLRPEFAAHRAQAMAALDRLPDSPRSVLVLFGGTDATGMAAIGARAAALAFPGATVRAVLPPAAPRSAPEGSGRITLLGHVDAIHEEMLAADLVLSAGGTTLWELCCLARPTAVIAVAANQVPTYDEMSAGGYILPAGREPVRDAAVLAATLRHLVARPGTLASVARQASRLTDGLGGERVADALAAAAER
jgi:UDP-2,4-diacetamido-2,4,6-trideoxy-beta-L-altropyranose hydrolase